jgi:epoxyqueuosine reductase
MGDPRQLSQAIKAKAGRLGFELVGITTAEPPQTYPVFERWLAQGRHGEMGYLDSERSRTRRQDFRQILAECRSVVVVGMRCPNPGDEPAPPGCGRVAAYAWGEDYHVVIPPRLEVLGRFIEELTGQPVAQRGYTDTGPILERDLAQRAGLGWMGKNTCLIHPRKGSYFLLGELLLELELSPDEAFAADHCGSCTRCIEACPTGCILPDRTLDARRCISYLTIELKGSLPLDLRPQLGEWVFGCDVCQQVCPWNIRFADRANPEASPAHLVEPFPNLSEMVSLTREAFNRRFKNTALKRTKRRGFVRNAAVALGNLGDPAAVPALQQCLTADDEALVRGHAAWALGQIGGAPARSALQHALAIEPDSDVRQEIRLALENLA